MRPVAVLIALAALPALSGCVAKAALDVATAPVKVAGKAVDVATTSQTEADEKRGREIREREERLGKLDRQYRQEVARCDAGDKAACEAARATYAELGAVMPTAPSDPAS